MTSPRYARDPEGIVHGLIPWGGGENTFCGDGEYEGVLEWKHLVRGRATCTACADLIREVRSLSLATKESP
jgi:hypothetical protein